MENETQEKKPQNMFVAICITQIICVAVILIALLITKFFFENSYTKFQKWCVNNIFEETVISDVFDEENSSEI